MRVFLSHNRADKEAARALGAYLVLAGLDVWFDDWEIQAGDSIPGKLNEGLEEFDAFILLWSASASRSNWVRREFESGIHKVIQSKRGKVIPCLLDDTPLPPLLGDIRAVDFKEPRQAIPKLVDDLRGFRTRKERLLSIQEVLQEMDVDWFGTAWGPLICCPRCGSEGTLEGHETFDRRGDRYEVVRCKSCGWYEANEL